MEGVYKERNIPVQPLSEESPLWHYITQKQVEITCSIITKIPQSLTMTKCCYKKQVHLCWWLAGVHFSRVHNDPTWTYNYKYTCSSLVELCDTFFFATAYKNTGIIFRYLSNLIFQQNWIGGVQIIVTSGIAVEEKDVPCELDVPSFSRPIRSAQNLDAFTCLPPVNGEHWLVMQMCCMVQLLISVYTAKPSLHPLKVHLCETHLGDVKDLCRFTSSQR